MGARARWCCARDVGACVRRWAAIGAGRLPAYARIAAWRRKWLTSLRRGARFCARGRVLAALLAANTLAFTAPPTLHARSRPRLSNCRLPPVQTSSPPPPPRSAQIASLLPARARSPHLPLSPADSWPSLWAAVTSGGPAAPTTAPISSSGCALAAPAVEGDAGRGRCARPLIERRQAKRLFFSLRVVMGALGSRERAALSPSEELA